MTFRAKSGASIWYMISRRLHASGLTVKQFRLFLWPGRGIRGMPAVPRIWGSVVLVTYWWRLGRGMFCGRPTMRMRRVDAGNFEKSGPLCTQAWRTLERFYAPKTKDNYTGTVNDSGGTYNLSHVTDFFFSILHLYSATSKLVLRCGGPKQDPMLGGVSTEGVWP